MGHVHQRVIDFVIQSFDDQFFPDERLSAVENFLFAGKCRQVRNFQLTGLLALNCRIGRILEPVAFLGGGQSTRAQNKPDGR